MIASAHKSECEYGFTGLIKFMDFLKCSFAPNLKIRINLQNAYVALC